MSSPPEWRTGVGRIVPHAVPTANKDFGLTVVGPLRISNRPTGCAVVTLFLIANVLPAV
jgi:hypothetical protein